MRFVIIGAGMAGILAAIRLEESGYDDVEIYEKADRVGGTWRENTYPGIGCDVPSHLYSYSFAPNAEWSHRYSPGPEIEDYFERVARERGVTQRVRFGEEVTRCAFEEGRWRLETSQGCRDEADFVIAATGVLHVPNVPEFPGAGEFEGALFHSARWDHSVPIDGRRIGIVGTGSSGVQIVGAIADRVAKLELFQRTAQWIAPQDNPPFSKEEKEEFRRHPETLVRLHRDLSSMFDQFSSGVVDAESALMKQLEVACLANLEETVRDPELRERLRPDHRAACKRLVISTNFYEAIQRPTSRLVTEAIERFEPSGIRTKDGELHELDVVVLATGFHADAFMRPMEVVGREGITLEQAWAERPTAYYSISIPGFPNLFMLNGPNGPVGNFSLIGVAELQMNYVLQLVDWVREGRGREVSPTLAATRDFDERRAEAATKTVWMTGCRSWYLDDRGIPAVWPWPFAHFREVMAAPDPSAWELA